MARINLLPWREEERQRKNKEFMVLASAVAAMAALVVLAGLMLLNNDLSNQNAANERIKSENARMDGVLTEIADLEQQKEQMIAQIKVIQDLQGHRSVPVRVWDDIARAVPQAMYLVGIKREGNTITLAGFADNPNVVSQLVRNLDSSPWLANSGVPNIQTDIEAYGSLIRERIREVAKSFGATESTRPDYPEDNYIQFTVTTQVKADEPTNTDPSLATDGTAAVQPPSGLNSAAANLAPSAESMSADGQPAQPQAAAPQPAQPTAAPAGDAMSAPVAAPTEVPAGDAMSAPVAQPTEVQPAAGGQ
ncbi:MAG: PilN domain-containing protein [Moraxella sp.]|nr:PilN domain-containing protein [Moraxella sp.]